VWSTALARCEREARRFRLSDADAQDVAQATVVRAWRRLPSLEDPERFDAWILAICRREALRLLASRREDVCTISSAERSGYDDQLRSAEQRIDLRRMLSVLAPLDRSVAWLRFGEDLTHREVAKRLGLSETAVRVRTHRLRALLARFPPPIET
jgi:RNA polymerase sigma-70 factor (ECF subfamily)